MAGLLDRSAHWAGGRGVFVQVGDILDRGVETRPVLDLLMRLEKEARPAGGRVIVLLGNHDVMNILGDLSAVQPAEYEEWKEPDTPASRTPSGKTRRMEFVDAATDRAREEAKAAGQAFDEAASRQKNSSTRRPPASSSARTPSRRAANTDNGCAGATSSPRSMVWPSCTAG